MPTLVAAAIVLVAALLTLYRFLLREFGLDPMDEIAFQQARSRMETIRVAYCEPCKFIRQSDTVEHRRQLMGLQTQINLDFYPLRDRKARALRREIEQLLGQLENHRKEANLAFIQRERDSAHAIFHDQHGHPLLTEEQLEAVLCDDDRNLIIAGAGSGKTRVIDFKVRYLVHHRQVDPKKIVLLSFSKKSASDLLKKISLTTGEIEVRTIHSFAAQFVNLREMRLFNDRTREQDGVVIHALSDALQEREVYEAFQFFYRNHFSPVKPMIFYDSLNALREDLKRINSRLIVGQDSFGEIKAKRALRTLRGDLVRSVDERYIADFLYLNDIEYVYEKKYPRSSEPYFPDFYLVDYDVYWEHFAIMKNGKPPTYFDDPKKYLDGMQWKRELHQRHGTRMIETLSYLLNQGDSSQYLDQVLTSHGITVRHTSQNTEMYSRISRCFSRLFSQFYQAYKMSGHDIEALTQQHDHPGSRAFLKVFKSFLQHYNRRIEESKKVDFNDLLILATQDFSQSMDPNSIEHLIIDEFQDTSNIALRFADAIQAYSTDISITTVGDDWQSIYGFNGSDVTIISEYEKRYAGTSVRHLNANFRSHPKIVDLGKRFISRNPAQIQKSVLSQNHAYDHSVVGFIPFDEMEREIERIPDHESIFFLYRYNDDSPATRGIFRKYFKLDASRKPVRSSECKKNIQLMTIHASKGLEARHVFILFPDGIQRTFPSEIEDHFIFDLVRARSDDYPFSEERRLMYVAITRAEQNVYFVSPHVDRSPSSVFWDELRELASAPSSNRGELD